MQRMSVLTIILGTVSLTGTACVGANWIHASSEASKAIDGYQLAQGSTESLNGLQASEQSLESAIVQSLQEHIGGQKGAKNLRAEAEKNINEMRNTLSQLSEQQDIAAANKHSLTVYTSAVQRDIHLAYVFAALWVAFGFAWALAPKNEATST